MFELVDVIMFVLIGMIFSSSVTAIGICYYLTKPEVVDRHTKNKKESKEMNYGPTLISILEYEHPELVSKANNCNLCPYQMGYEHPIMGCLPNKEKCKRCWNKRILLD